MKYSGLIRNDLAAAPGISVSFFVQGCPHRCKGCHNPETWDFNRGKEFTVKTLDDIIDSLDANGIERSFCIMGGEPMCQENLFLTYFVLRYVKLYRPNVKTYVWTGYYYEDLLKMGDPKVRLILEDADYLIDGPYIEALRDVSLPMRGSSNQSVIDLKEKRNGRNL